MRKLWNFVNHSFTLTAISIIVGFLSSVYFYNKGVSKTVADTVLHAAEEGRSEGQKEGLKASQVAFEANLPALIDQRYPGLINLEKRAAYNDGLEKGKSAGRLEALQQGRQIVKEQCSIEVQNDRNWAVYESLVTKVAERIAASPQQPVGNIDKVLYDRIDEIIRNAEVLNESYHDKALAFDSIVHDIRAALDKKDFDQVRRLVIALKGRLACASGLIL